MILKTQTSASENNKVRIGNSKILRKYLLRKNHIEEILIPSRFISDLEEFARRNYLPHIEECCPQCLKAHAIKRAEEHNLSREEIGSLKSLFKGKIGHNGYYLDKEKLIEL